MDPASWGLCGGAPKPEPELHAPATSGRWGERADGGLAGGEIVLEFEGVEAAPVQIASDLHLEFIREGCGADLDLYSIVTPVAPILALLGDIGIPTHPLYRHFLLHQAERYEAVLVLTGNHEFYDVRHGPTPAPREGQTWAEAERQRVRHGVDDMEREIQSICDLHPSLHYVDNRVVRLGNAADAPALLCTPLWSHIPRDAMDQVRRSLNDYTMAFVADGAAAGSETAPRNAAGQMLRRLKPEDTSRFHALAVGWLQREVARLRQECGVRAMAVMSHHTPAMVGTSHPRFEGANASPTQHAFSSDLAEIYGSVPELKAWAYGHTHFNNDRWVTAEGEGAASATRLLSNQRGYAHEVSNAYRADKCFELLLAEPPLTPEPSS